MSGSAGGVVAIAEPDYAYGTGVLYLKIEKVDRANPVRYGRCGSPDRSSCARSATLSASHHAP